MIEPQEYERDFIDEPILSKAAAWLADAAWAPEGALCPCCGKFDKVYTRKITRPMILALGALLNLHEYRTDKNGFHYSEFCTVPGDFAKMLHVDCAARVEKGHLEKKSSGVYAITATGVAFLKNEIRIPEGFLLHRGEVVGIMPETKLVTDFWPEFNYRDLFK